MEEKSYFEDSVGNEFHIVEGTNIAIKLSNFRKDMVAVARDTDAATDNSGRHLVKEQSFPTEDPQRVKATNDAKKFVSYGLDNLFPQNIEKIIRRNSKLRVGLATTAKDLIGLGIETGEYVYQDNKKLFVPKEFKNFDLFYDRANVLRNYTVLAARQLKTHYMLFVLVILSSDGKKVAALKTIPTRKCRLDEQDSTGTHQKCYVSNHWEDGIVTADDERVKSYDVIDTFFDSAVELKSKVENSKKREFIYVVKFPTEEEIYALADWISVIEQGWVDVSNDVPAFKRWLLQNSTTIPQIIYISEKYWSMRYPDWSDLEKRAAKKDDDGKVAFGIMENRRNELVKEIKTKLSGISKSGNMITSPMLRETFGNQSVETKAITIEPIKGNDYTGKYNADANEADSQILFALSIDPSRFGNLTRTDSQGGTSKREGHNIAQAMEYIFEQLLLEVLYFKRDYDADASERKMQIRIKRVVTPTLEEITPSEREIDPTK